VHAHIEVTAKIVDRRRQASSGCTPFGVALRAASLTLHIAWGV
jgi:hypothetical protein